MTTSNVTSIFMIYITFFLRQREGMRMPSWRSTWFIAYFNTKIELRSLVKHFKKNGFFNHEKFGK